MGWLDEILGQMPQSQAANYPTPNYAQATQPTQLPFPAATPPVFAPGRPDQTNFDAANAALGMSPQEQALYQRHLSNLYGAGGVDNMNGSRSTLYQMSTDMNGKTYNLPTVYDGQILHPDQAIARAQQIGLHQFPAYSNSDQAESRYQQMHGYMDRDTARYFGQRK